MSDNVCSILLHRLRSNEHAAECATLRSTGVLFWLFHRHTGWPSPPPQAGAGDIETAFIARWVAEQYPTLAHEVIEQDREFALQWGSTTE